MKKDLVTKFLVILFFTIFVPFDSHSIQLSGYKVGKGPLKISKNTADFLEYFFSGGTRGIYAKKQKEPWKPGNVAISVDGKHFSYYRHPNSVTVVDNKFYTGKAITKCKIKSGQECYTFAIGYRIKWDNGTSKKSRILKRKEIKAGKTIAKLIELGFYDGSTSSSTSTSKVIENKTSKKYKEDLVYFNKCSGTSDKEKYHDSFEIDLKNNTIYQEFFAEGEVYESRIEIALNNDNFIQTIIDEYGDDSYVKYEFNKKNYEVTSFFYKDKKGKIKDGQYVLICDDIIGTLKNKNKKPKIIKKNDAINDKDIVKKLKDLKELLDSGVLSKEEFEKAKKKLLN